MHAPRTFRLFVLSTSLLAGAPLAAQQLASEGVIFAFTQMRLGEASQYVLMPVAADSVRPAEPLTSSVPSAFLLLRNGKPAIYGNTSITLTDSMAAEGRVTVSVDPGRAANFELIAAETVYTFTQLGIDEVEFPGFADEPLDRGDVTYTAYRLQVPMWQALVGVEVHESDVLLLDGTRVDAAEFYTRMEDGDTRVHGQVLELVREGSPAARFGLLGVIATLGVPGFEDAVIPSLTDPDPTFRDAALRALVGSSDPAAWEAIVLMMNADPEPGLRTAAAVAVAASPIESVRLNELFFRATTPDPTIRLAAVREMSEISDDRVPNELLRYVGDADPTVSQAAIDGLTLRGAWDALEMIMGDEAGANNVRLAAAGALASASTGDSRLAGLAFTASTLDGELAIAAIDAIAALDDRDPRETLEAMLQHRDAPVRVHAAGVIGGRGDTASLGALSDAAEGAEGDIDMRNASAEAAFAIISSQESDRVERFASDSDPFVRAAAFRALGAMALAGQGSSNVYDRLVAGLADSNEQIRAACAIAVAGFGTQQALDAILALRDDPSSQVVGAMALGLGSFPGEAWAATVNPVVVDLLASGDPEIIAGAVDALGLLGQVALRPAVIEKITFADARVRAAAMRAAALLADPAAPREVISAIAGQMRDEVASNRVLAAELLGGFSDDSSVLLLSQFVTSTDLDLRFAAIDALGHTGLRGAGMVLLGLIEDPDRGTRLAAIASLRTLSLRDMVPDMQGAAARDQDPVSSAALLETIDWLLANGS